MKRPDSLTRAPARPTPRVELAMTRRAGISDRRPGLSTAIGGFQ
jgi:hypothetical protein